MVAKSSTRSRSVCWNVAFGACTVSRDGSIFTGFLISPFPLFSKFLLCSSGVLISFYSTVFCLVYHSKLSSLLPLYTRNFSFRSQQCLCVTQFHHNNSKAIKFLDGRLVTISMMGADLLTMHFCLCR